MLLAHISSADIKIKFLGSAEKVKSVRNGGWRGEWWVR
jgi:hypothetical protein